jgi:ribosomal protein S18 acetylase RimI-like enzyme
VTAVEIRPCGRDDLDIIRQVSIETYDQAFRSMNTNENMDAYLEAAFSREKLRNELSNEKSRFFLLHCDGAVCGYLKLNEAPAQSDLNDPDSLEIERIYVRGEFQGRGLGRTLMDHAIRLARQLGKRYVWLGVWEKNADALAFYGRMGFSAAGRHPFWVGEDLQTDLIMKKMLSG